MIFAAVVLCCNVAFSDEKTTLSILTTDGLVVAEVNRAEAAKTERLVSNQLGDKADTASVVKWFEKNGYSKDGIRSYLSKSEYTEKPSVKKWEKIKLYEAVSGGEIPRIIGLDYYEAYMVLGSYGKKFHSARPRRSRGRGVFNGMNGKSVFVFSSAYGNGNDGIFIDGTDYSKGSIGYNLVAVGSNGEEIIGVEGYELYNDPGASHKMAEFLKSLPEGSYLAAAVRFGPGVFLTSEAVAELAKFGSAAMIDPELLMSHAMIGRKGQPPGTAVEATAVNAGSSEISFAEDVFVGLNEAGDPGHFENLSSIVITGVSNDDFIYLYR